MRQVRWISPVLIGVIVAIGCGSGKPQDAAARTEDAAQPAAPMQLAEAPAGTALAATGSSSIQGAVKFEGTAPTLQKINMGADPVCKQHPEPLSALIVEEGAKKDYIYVAVNANSTLKDVFVYVKEGLAGSFPAPTAPVVLDQAGCRYHPHVFGIQVNQPLEIVNSDPTLHNVNAKPTINQPFNLAQPSNKSPKMTKQFAKPEVMVKFLCNVHSWMRAYGGVVAHPFFSVSGDDGAFAITGLPAGTYVVEAWHEKYGTKTQTVTVADGQAATADFTFAAQ